MGCFVALFPLLSPRLALFGPWLSKKVLSRAFDSWVVPLLGFFLLPWTTLAYAALWDWISVHHVTGFDWFFVILAFLVDLGSSPRANGPVPGDRRASAHPTGCERVSARAHHADAAGAVIALLALFLTGGAQEWQAASARAP